MSRAPTFLAALALIPTLVACSPPRAIEATKVLADVAAGDESSWLERTTPEPTRMTLAGASGNSVLGDLYWPGEPAAGALVLVPGAVAEGKDDPRLVAFADTFARARFAVLVPEIPNLRTQELSADDALPIRRAIHHLAGCFASDEEAALGVVAISYAAGPAMLAVLEPETAALVGFVLAIGGYYDVEALITFFTTGYYRAGPDAPWRYQEPNAYGKWVFVKANAERLSGPADRRALTEMAARKLDELDADVSDLRSGLGPEGEALMALLDNRDPERVPELIAALPEATRAEMRALDLARRDLSWLPFDLILLHGRDDPIIPSTESRALAAAAPGERTSLYVVDSLSHVELGPAGLSDSIKLWRAVYRLLSQRAELPAPDAGRCASDIQEAASSGR